MRSHQQLHTPLRKIKGFLGKSPINKIKWSPEIHPKIRNVLDYINTHYTDHPKLSDAGSLIGLHPSHLCRTFKRETGVNISIEFAFKGLFFYYWDQLK